LQLTSILKNCTVFVLGERNVVNHLKCYCIILVFMLDALLWSVEPPRFFLHVYWHFLVWGQIHWNVFKYKYFSFGQIQIHSFVNVFKYKYFLNEKNKFIVFSLLFILIRTLHNIKASTRFFTSIYEFFVDYTWET